MSGSMQSADASGSAAGADELAAALAKLWEEHRPASLERVEVLEDVVAALVAGELDDAQREEGRAAAHKLRGSAGTYGFNRASQIAAELEDRLASGGQLGLDLVPRFSELVLELREELERRPTGEPAASQPGAQALPILLVAGDADRAASLAGPAAAAGLSLRVIGGERAIEALDEVKPQLVVVDLDSVPEPYGLLGSLSSHPRAVRTMVLAGAGATIDRVEAIRRGARGFLRSSLPPERLIATLAHSVEGDRGPRASVLVVDDDAAFLAVIEAMLTHDGYRVTTLREPTRFWELLDREHPDLVLVDIEMPEINGIEICEAVRSDPERAGLPLLIVTAYREPEIIRRAYAAGADDYLVKPVVEEELLARVRNRLERARAQDVATRDPLTGTLLRPTAVAALSNLVEFAGEMDEPLSLALLDVDRLAEVNRGGLARGDELLRRFGETLRDEFEPDPVGRWDGDVFVVAMPGLLAGDAARRTGAVIERLRRRGDGDAEQIAALINAGVGAGADSVEGLLDLAETALARAKGGRGGRVEIVDRTGNAVSESVDVVIVEDDDAVADVLRFALAGERLSMRRMVDGPEAVAALSGEQPALTPRAVLLDWDLPGLDGLSVLRELRARGSLASTRVIMVTARGTEEEMLLALEEGAADYVTKPFSVPVLIERIRKALAP